MKDLIDRQAAIDALRDAENHAFNSFYQGLIKAHKIIADLPSAQPEKRTQERTETHACDCISRQAAISELMEWVKKEENKSWSIFKGSFHWTGIKAMLECLPPVQPEQRSFSCGQENDLISRRAAIDKLDPIFESLAIDKIKALPSAEPEQRWIPCSERLPDNDESVLISNSHGVTKAWWNGRFWTSIAVKKYKTVTAWMPLPEPWKGDTRE